MKRYSIFIDCKILFCYDPKLGQGTENYFYKDSDCMYFKICGPYNFYCNYSTLHLQDQSTTDNVKIDEHDCV